MPPLSNTYKPIIGAPTKSGSKASITARASTRPAQPVLTTIQVPAAERSISAPVRPHKSHSTNAAVCNALETSLALP